VNVDIAPQREGVIACDISRGLPFPAAHFDVVYHSHVIEHLRRPDAEPFIRECGRVLKPGGVLRVATPDLEQLCALYLAKCHDVAAGAEQARADHEWLVVEMLDQSVREQSGGGMLTYLRRDPLVNESFILSRIGEEGRAILAAARAPRPATSAPPALRLDQRFRAWLRMVPSRSKARLAEACFGTEAVRAIQVGKFRLAGEVHQWLYDRISLAALLSASGFRDPALRTAAESAIPDWMRFGLDTMPDGSVRKPDSLFMEARKPA
jgi:SAM-dependent methyltransferase